MLAQHDPPYSARFARWNGPTKASCWACGGTANPLAIVELLTRSHGRHLGLVRGGAGCGCGPCCSPAIPSPRCGGRGSTSISAIYPLEGPRLRAATLLASSHAVYGVTYLAALARLLPERDPHEDIYEMLERTLDDFDEPAMPRFTSSAFELAMLAELGFGLDLANCAATGETTDLIYVSPKSGGAVSRCAGEPWRDRLLRLPPFLREGEDGANGWSDQDLQDGFRLTGLFLLRHVLEPRGQGHSDAREGFINAVTRYQAANRLGGVTTAIITTVVPAKAGAHTPRSLKRSSGVSNFFPYKHLWLWVPAFAGTTSAPIRVLPDSPPRFNRAAHGKTTAFRRKSRPKSTRCTLRDALEERYGLCAVDHHGPGATRRARRIETGIGG